ncbi:MAG: hypothetical protein MSG64_09935 [Pyrinomonadaceae bacterium MAG19_C2-C3]|nr:hypothetical protein [Pyrinomonadaceae bacterium MAG19_C2-C3]
MYCRHCGAEVGSEQKHCKKCGAKQLVGRDTDENPASGNNELAIITKIFIAVCFVLMFVAGIQMLGNDNYLGLIAVILGFGSLIYGLFWWQSRQATRFQKSKPDSGRELGSEDEKLLLSGKEQFSVTEEATRKLESAKLRGKH